MAKKILCIIGTRPECIKMAPIIFALKTQEWADLKVIATAQHRGMLDQMLALFNIKPDLDLNIMEPNQSLSLLTSKLLTKLTEVFTNEQPEAVIAQGDTTTTFVSALACFYLHIPFYHVEAGLRSEDIYNPFPEEMNRILTDRLSTLLFAPTERNKDSLLAEGIKKDSIYVTGNTVIDSLNYIVKKPVTLNLDLNKRTILVTAHRRESFGPPFHELCSALKILADKYDDVQIVVPVHPNPNVSQIIHQNLDNHPNILLIPPMDYDAFITLINQSYLVLTDSGGVQEEAPALGKPVLVLRETTERPEGVEAGVAKLVPMNSAEIIAETTQLLDSKEKYNAMVKKVLPYGDGTAALQIVAIIKNKLL